MWKLIRISLLFAHFWQKLDLRVGTIIRAEEHPNADKLYMIKVDLGDEKKNVVAGLRQAYTKDELIGKKVIVFCNLEPAVFRGVKSDGMVLAAVDNDNISLLTPDEDVSNGAKVR